MILLFWACATDEGEALIFRPPPSFQEEAVLLMARAVPGTDLDLFLGGVQQRAIAGELTIADLEDIEADVLEATSEDDVSEERVDPLLHRWQVEPTPFRPVYRMGSGDARSSHLYSLQEQGFVSGCPDLATERCAVVHPDGRRYTVWMRTRTWSGPTETTWSDRAWGAYCEEHTSNGTSIRYEYHPNAGTPDPALPEHWEPDGAWVVGEQSHHPERVNGLRGRCAWYP